VTNPENEEVVRRMVARARIEGSGEEEQIELALDLFVGLPPCSTAHLFLESPDGNFWA
jgi:hypothetical protein